MPISEWICPKCQRYYIGWSGLNICRYCESEEQIEKKCEEFIKRMDIPFEKSAQKHFKTYKWQHE